MKIIILLISFMILSLSSCSVVKLKGSIIGGSPYASTSIYKPPIGNVVCQSLDVVNSRNLSEKYSKYGGIVDIWNAGFPYRLDMHLTTSKLNDSEFDYKKYFHKEALPHLLKDFPNGEPIEESKNKYEDKYIYYGLLFYKKQHGGLNNLFEKSSSSYRAIIIYKSFDVIYTVSRSWPSTYWGNNTFVDRKEQMYSNGLSAFSKCKFNEQIKNFENKRVEVPNILNVKIIDSPNYNNDLFRYVDWNNEYYGPGAFIAVVKNRGVTRINFNDSDLEKKQCAAYIGKKLKAKVYNIDSENISHEIIQKPNLKKCSIQQPVTSLESMNGN